MAFSRLSSIQKSLCNPLARLALLNNSRNLSQTPQEPELQGLGVALAVSPKQNRPPNEHAHPKLAQDNQLQHPASPPDIEKEIRPVNLAQLRKEYAQQLSMYRKKYARQVERKRQEEARQEKIRREKIVEAKKKRLELKKERSAQRALEVAEENRILQAQLAKERAEKAMHRQAIERKIEERKQKKHDILKRQSVRWIKKDDLEQRIMQAMLDIHDL